ncbi:hypothetical protein [Desulfitobacterium hafniense]|uniref:hypothetical protein n=1 Tax=Desulfitobacterium hafniense TaxID=49338 RepID=UPI00059CCCE4|nr:hypothetical protein [Desulfitobacterium hafniense]
MPLNADDIERELLLAKDYPHDINLFDKAAEMIKLLQARLDAAINGQETLQKYLSESQRRERAAVEDLEGSGACFSCKHFRRNKGACSGGGECRIAGITIIPCDEPCTYRIEVPDDGRNTYEWRGPQEVQK